MPSSPPGFETPPLPEDFSRIPPPSVEEHVDDVPDRGGGRSGDKPKPVEQSVRTRQVDMKMPAHIRYCLYPSHPTP